MPKTKILIVEDDDIVARVIAWRLNNIGYEVCGRATSRYRNNGNPCKRVPGRCAYGY